MLNILSVFLLATSLLTPGRARAGHAPARTHAPAPTLAPDARCGQAIAKLVVLPRSIGPVDSRTRPWVRVARKLFPGCVIAAGKQDDGEGDLLDTIEVSDARLALRLIASGPGKLGSVEIVDPRIQVPGGVPAGAPLSALRKLGALGCERGNGQQANLYECRVAGVERLRFVAAVLPEDERAGGRDPQVDRPVLMVRWYPPER